MSSPPGAPSLDVDAASQSRQRILATDVPAIFANGNLIFQRAGTLMARIKAKPGAYLRMCLPDLIL